MTSACPIQGFSNRWDGLGESLQGCNSISSAQLRQPPTDDNHLNVRLTHFGSKRQLMRRPPTQRYEPIRWTASRRSGVPPAPQRPNATESNMRLSP
jgi:hypothetical protein